MKRGTDKSLYIFAIILFILLLFLARISAESAPNNLWNATLNGPQGSYDYGYDIAIDSSGSIYVTGSSYWSSNESRDIYLGKFNSSGSNLWNRTVNGLQGYMDYGQDVDVDSSGNIYVAGGSYWSNNGSRDIYLGKFNSSGSNLWNRTINNPQGYTDDSEGVAVDSSGNIYVIGYGFWSSNESRDLYLGKFNSSGSNLWNATLNGPQGYYDEGYDVAIDSSGNIYVSGSSYWSTNGSRDLYLGKFNSSGSNLWNRTINGLQDSYDYSEGVAVDSSGNIYLTGYGYWLSDTYYDLYLGKFNSSGSNLWNATLNGPQDDDDYLSAVAVDSSGNIYLTGYGYWISNLHYDLYLGKWDSSGSNLWNKTINGPQSSDDYSSGIVMDSSGNIYLAGDSYWSSNETTDIYLGKFKNPTFPTVSFLGITNTVNNGNYSGTIIVNASVSDDFAVNSVYFNVTYSNGTQLNFVKASANGAGYYNISLNTLEFSDNQYNITVYANDSAGNLNNSERIQIIMDNTNPTGIMTCSPADTSVGGTITCTCTSSDATSGINSAGNTYTTSPSTSVAGEGFTQTCTFADNAGNSGSAISNAYTIWTTTSSSSSTPTATPSAPPVDIVTEAIPVTQPEAPAEITINEPGLDLTAVTIETTETVEGLSVEVSTVAPPLSAEVGIVGTSYQAFEINTFTSSSKIKNAKIDFKVNKTWISERQGKAKDVRLQRKENNSATWNILPTKLVKEDNNSYYYAATTPGFSTFVIFLGTYECTPGEVRCAEKDVQMCLGNSTWLITEQCKRCRDNQCTAAVPISLIVYCALIAMAGIVVLFVVYLAFFNKKSGNKKEKEITRHFRY